MAETTYVHEPTVGADPWRVREEDFPSIGPSASKLRFLLQYAVLAPSGHNTQPWLFRIVGDHVDVYADRTRALPVVDPEDRALTISCGAAIQNLTLALRHFGYREKVDFLPDPKDPDFLARVEIAGVHRTTDADRRLFRAILGRRTNRLSFESRPLPGDLLAALAEEAEIAGAHLVVTQDAPPKDAIATLIAEGDRTQLRDPSFRRELAAWIHPARHRTRDGIPGTALGVSLVLDSIATPALSLVVRTFDIGRGRAATDRALAEGSPALTTIWTAGDTPRHWLVAGMALARVLLRAQGAGVSASYLNQPIEVPTLRPRFRQLIGIAGYPQLLLRLGYGPSLDPTPRRAVEETMR
ncbi:MAG TPA: nitroreductase [Acidobacteriota bacterium]|nr:nitroreductase [Acidobacteriota bacterium]